MCKYGNARCLCQDCRGNAALEGCDRGYCINCFECEDKGKAVHDIYLCTGYETKEEKHHDP